MMPWYKLLLLYLWIAPHVVLAVIAVMVLVRETLIKFSIFH